MSDFRSLQHCCFFPESTGRLQQKPKSLDKKNPACLQRYPYINATEMAPETTGAEKTDAVRSCKDFG